MIGITPRYHPQLGREMEIRNNKRWWVQWKRPQVFYNHFRQIEFEGGFKSLEEAQNYANNICLEYRDYPPAELQVFQSMKIEEYCL